MTNSIALVKSPSSPHSSNRVGRDISSQPLNLDEIMLLSYIRIVQKLSATEVCTLDSDRKTRLRYAFPNVRNMHAPIRLLEASSRGIVYAYIHYHFLAYLASTIP